MGVVDPSIGGPPEPPTLLVVGAATRDIDPQDDRGWRLGGTVAYASVAAARLGVPVRALIGVDSRSAGAAELDAIRAAGVQVHAVQLERGPVFENISTPTGRVQIARQASDSIPFAALPSDWRDSTVVLFGPVAGELGDDWATAVRPDALVGLAWQGLLRTLSPGNVVRRLSSSRTALVARADLIVASAEDFAPGRQPIMELLVQGQELVLTHGVRGAFHLQRKAARVSARFIPALPPRIVVDTTGAGDVFLAAWLSGRLLLPDLGHNEAWRPLALAATMASLSVEGRGLEGLPGRREICEALIRLRDRRLR